MKPQLADNWLEDKQRLPAWQQPKWDGVRGGFWLPDTFTGRSLKPFKNKALTAFWSQPIFKYLDGELVLPGAVENTARLCSLTTGMCNRVAETEVPDLIAFDYLRPDLIAKGATYADRYGELALLIDHLHEMGDVEGDKLRLVESYPVTSFERVLELDDQFLDRGLEGSILRNHLAPHKEGRPSSKVQELMRIKRFIDAEAKVVSLEEAMENTNEAKTNELGRTERSTAKAGLVPKGMVGKLKCELLADLALGSVTLKAGQLITVGPGQLTHPERIHYWNNQHELVGQIIKFKTFPQGVKDKPRMPLFLSLRSEEDMS